jgi:hypothetical protein
MADESDSTTIRRLQESQQLQTRSQEHSAAKSLLGDASTENPVQTQNNVVFDPPATATPAPADDTPAAPNPVATTSQEE